MFKNELGGAKGPENIRFCTVMMHMERFYGCHMPPAAMKINKFGSIRSLGSSDYIEGMKLANLIFIESVHDQ